MSLRFRLLAAIFLALLASFSLSAGLSVWHASRTTRADLAASLRDAGRSAQAALGILPAGAAGSAALRGLVEAFDGSRHLQAALVAPGGAVAVMSRPAAIDPPPRWFVRLTVPAMAPISLPVRGVPGIAALLVTVDPVSEAAERWGELRGRLAGFATFFALAGLLGSVIVARSLRPLIALAQGLARLGRGETPPDLPVGGPPEVAGLARAFNGLSAALARAEARNRQLSLQVLTIAEEERAEIARDLHDEIGPLLFAITNFAAAIGRQVELGDVAGVPAQIAAIQDATARVQRGVRDMLDRLDEAGAAPDDLPASLADLLDFWRSVRPETGFSLMADPVERLSAEMRECLFRAAQEGVNNAVRHGRPRHVTVRLGAAAGDVSLSVADDGAGGVEKPGRGLAGMRARAAALGGTVGIARERGWEVTVRLPREDVADTQLSAA